MYEKTTGRYKSLTYKEVKEQVHKVAAGFLALGLSKGDRVELFSEARNDSVISKFGVLYSGAICVPLSILLKKNSDLKFRLDHSQSRWIIVSANLYEKINCIKQDLKNLDKIILLDPLERYSHNEIFLGRVKELGEECMINTHNRFIETMTSIGPDDYACICYTSGTTADPKGILLSHRNYTA